VDGEARGTLLRVSRPLSFWGGIDPDTGAIIDPHQPKRGTTIGGTILAIPTTVGSSSSSAIILELLRNGNAPAALVLGQVDAILTLGVVVAREMGYPTIPVLELSVEEIERLPEGRAVAIALGGVLVTE
jgi:predicted aconitase with swiveling domain